VIENFIGTKSRRKILEGLKQKIGIFIETKNIFNPMNNNEQIPSSGFSSVFSISLLSPVERD